MSRRLALAIGAALAFLTLAILEVFMVNADTLIQGGALR
jgi:hypothetical protein